MRAEKGKATMEPPVEKAEETPRLYNVMPDEKAIAAFGQELVVDGHLCSAEAPAKIMLLRDEVKDLEARGYKVLIAAPDRKPERPEPGPSAPSPRGRKEK